MRVHGFEGDVAEGESGAGPRAGLVEEFNQPEAGKPQITQISRMKIQINVSLDEIATAMEMVRAQERGRGHERHQEKWAHAILRRVWAAYRGQLRGTVVLKRERFKQRRARKF